MSLLGLVSFLVVLALDCWLVLALIIGLMRRANGLDHTVRVTEVGALVEIPVLWVKHYFARKRRRPISDRAAWLSVVATVLLLRHVLACFTVWSAG